MRGEDNPFNALHRQMDELFEYFFDDFQKNLRRPSTALCGFEASLPSIDVLETDSELLVTADLPGMEEKDVEVTLDNNVLTIHGNRKDEREEKKKNYYISERSYGEFHRTIPLPTGIDKDRVKAEFKKDVLKVSLPKRPEAKTEKKKIEIAAG